MNKTITIETIVNKDIATVWKLWTGPEHIMVWNHASPDWECPKAENELATGGRFSFTMSSKDKTQSFDFSGVYNEIVEDEYIAYTMEDGRKAEVFFKWDENGTKITETFEMENENSEEMQRAGWQAILENFKTYTESWEG